MFRWLLLLSLCAPSAFARHKREAPVSDFPAPNRDAEELTKLRQEARDYKARVAQAAEDELIRAAAYRFANQYAQEARATTAPVFTSHEWSTYYFRLGGFRCSVNVRHSVAGDTAPNTFAYTGGCRDVFSGAVTCASATDESTIRYQDEQPRALERDGRCYQPWYGY